ncbi:MAG: hypothetical protein KQI35_12035 [Bacteroidetes bacterium]|nr:hypothetical protein [Bacteroidota bacterium]
MENFIKNIKSIRHDTTSGSLEILKKTINELLGVLDRITPGKEQKTIITNELNRLFFEQSGFAVLFHFINAFFLEIEKGFEPTELKSFILRYEKQWSKSEKLATNRFIDHFDPDKKLILLHSNSSTIHQYLAEIHERGLHTKIIQTLSGPGNEGRIQAKAALEKGFEVTLIHESAVGKFISEIDWVVFGADVITEKMFINKTGTFEIAALFNHQNKPVYVIGDSRKLIDTSTLPDPIAKHLLDESPKSPEEIWSEAPRDIKIKNYWFEATPHELVSGLSTESEWISPVKTIKKFSQDKISRLFNTN